jgi:hypothetical protein
MFFFFRFPFLVYFRGIQILRLHNYLLRSISGTVILIVTDPESFYLVTNEIQCCESLTSDRCKDKGEGSLNIKCDFFSRFLQYFIQHCFICRPSDLIVSEDAVIEPRFRHWLSDALTNRLDLIHNSARFHSQFG